MRRFDLWFRGVVVALTATIAWSVWAAVQTNSAAMIEFATRTFTVGENATVANITLQRVGSTNEAIKVVLVAAPGTASPEEFSAPTGPIEIAAGKAAYTLPIRITDDIEPDGNKTVRLSLGEISGAVAGSISTAELVITDNERVQPLWMTLGLDRVGLLRRTMFHIPLWQYFASLIYIFLSFYVSKLFDYWIRGRVKRWAGRTRTALDDILLELLGRPFRIIIFVVLLHIGLRIFSWPQWFASLLSKALTIVVAVSLTYVALRFVDVLTGYWRRRASAEEDRSFAEQLLPIIRNSLKVFAAVVAVLLTLQNLGLNITSLITSLGIGGLALALAAQDTLANFFGAIVILVDKPFRIGDTVRIEPIEGTVEAIGFRSTRVRTADGHLVAIPNKTVGNSVVTNITRRPHIRTVMNLSLQGKTPPEKTRRAVAILEEVFGQHPDTKEISVSFNKFSDAAVNLQVIYVWNGTDARKQAATLQTLNLQVKERFENEGIQFA